MPNDVFGLNAVYDRQVDSTWSESANYGYFAGGSAPPYVCTIDRIDFSNETTSLPGSSLTRAITNSSSTSSSDYGYFGGGFYGSGVTDEVVRIDFFSETVALPPVGTQLSRAGSGIAGVSGSDYGYFAGGRDPGAATQRVCTIDRIDFSSETVAAPPVGNQLTEARNSLEGVFSSNYSYFAGGFAASISARVCTIDRLDFSTETTSAPGNNLTKTIDSFGVVSGSNYGYFAGGFSPPYDCTIDRIDFSSETVLEIGGTLSEGVSGAAGVFSSNYGYFAGGFFIPPPTRVCNIDRIDFSSETVAVPPVGNQLTQARNSATGVSGGKSVNARGVRKGSDKDGKGISSTYGYVAGGASPPNRSTFDRLDYSTESIDGPAVHGLVLRTSRRQLSSFGNKNYGYFCNGWNPDGSAIDRIDFSNETRSDNLISTYPAYQAQSVHNSNYGYVCGGNRRYPPSILSSRSIIERMDFETESLTITNSTLENYLSGSAAVSTPNYGYFGGGNRGGSIVCLIERFDFSNETSVLLTSTMSQRKYSSGSFQNPNYGYFYGGTAPGTSPSNNSKVERLDFSIDFVTSPGNMPEIKNGSCGVFNLYHGYICGATNTNANVHRMEFSDETFTLLSSTLSQARNGVTGLSN